MATGSRSATRTSCNRASTHSPISTATDGAKIVSPTPTSTRPGTSPKTATSATPSSIPLLHYVEHGEAEGRRPIAHFDPDWYRARYALAQGQSPLAHFLQHRSTGRVSPIPEFDAEYYLDRYPDVAAAGMDPFEHYLVQGASEDRQPAAEFDSAWYRVRYLRHEPAAIPLLHYRMNRHLPGIHATRPPQETDIPTEVRRNTRPSPLFEELSPPPATAARRALLLAYYLPQFHAVPENDAWWGNGFTEWTNVARALPRFAGHYQPRIPRDLGHYRLEGTATLRRQAEMARAAGLHGFVFYFYWFDGKRLLDSPLEALLADRSVDLPFCLMWANENWTRRWDGSDHELLLAQNYRPADEPGLVQTFLRHFADPRYIRLEGRPVLMVYRAGLIPAGAVARWRRLFAAAGEDPLFIMAQSFDDRDPRRFGMDAAVEFPPHKLTSTVKTINASLHMLDPAATGQVFAYDDLAAATDLTPQPFPLIRTAIPGWDNDPRRQGAGMAVHGATPAAYEAWLNRLIDAAREQPVCGEAIVCINAWNEWGEGAYLEPDVHFGAAFLNATGRAVTGRGGAGLNRLLLVGHDAFPAGAQLLLLNLARTLRAERGAEIAFLLLGEGALLPAYRAAGPTTVLADPKDLPDLARAFAAQGFTGALVNTSAASPAVPALAAAGLAVTLLVHEMPRLLRERNLIAPVCEAVEHARTVVFSAAHVRDRFTELSPIPPARCTILPQGLYRPVDPAARDERRARLRLPPGAILAVGIGYADLRKGFDLFLQVWRLTGAKDPAVHMLWVGDIDPTVRTYLGAEMAIAEAAGTFHHEPFTSDGTDWLAAADIHLLTSREDPLPSVVLEAMSAGIPTLAFDESGGAPDLLREHDAGAAVPLGDCAAMARLIRPTLARFRPALRTRLARTAREQFDFPAYAGQLLRLACPALLEVSVVIPNYNYAHYLPARLRSIFDQTHPVAEIIVLDDASSDDSEFVTAETAAAATRTVRWAGSRANSGSVFRQWRRAALMARSEWLWIAEADDGAEPGFLATLAAALAPLQAHTHPDAPGPVLAFSDSAAIDADGELLWPDHQGYYRQSGAALLAEDYTGDATALLQSCLAERNLIVNASAVLWHRESLLAALDRCAPDLDTFTMAGDWRLYAELLAAGGRVAYVAKPLNRHRRHADSVTHRLAPAQHLAEIERMHRHMRHLLGAPPGLLKSQRRALNATRVALTGKQPA